MQVSTYTLPVDKCIVISGEGTHQQILLLRKEILKLICFDRAMSYGAFRSKANKYVMDGATMLFARQAESQQQCMLALEPYAIGQVNRAHRERSSASTLTMRSAPCDNDSWMETFQTAFVTKVHTNAQYSIYDLTSVCTHHSYFPFMFRPSTNCHRWMLRPAEISYSLFILESST